jgi:putative transposase
MARSRGIGALILTVSSVRALASSRAGASALAAPERVSEELCKRPVVVAWQNRPLDAVYPIVYLDALMVKVRDQGVVRNKAVYIALGVTLNGSKEVLGLWIEQNEGAKFWLKVVTELKNRGLRDILIACCDGLKGLPEAIEAAFPQAMVQSCIVHMLRNSLRFVSYKDRKAVAKELRPVYTATTREEAAAALEVFAQKWARRYPMIAESWKSNWERVVPFLDFPADVRRVIYTTNAIESLNSSLRKLLHYRGSFPTDEAVFKLLYLALANIEKRWGRTIRDWDSVLGQFAIFFKDRIPE